MSGYWLVIAPVAVAALAGVVALSRHLAYHPAHAAARGQLEAAAAPDTGSMILAEELSWGWRRPPERPADADPWGTPEEEWTEQALAELHDGLTALDQLEPAPMPQYEPAPLRWYEWGAAEPAPDDMQLALEANDRAELGIAPLEPPAAVLAEFRHQAEQLEPAAAPWYEGAWIDGQLAELFAWVRRVRAEL